MISMNTLAIVTVVATALLSFASISTASSSPPGYEIVREKVVYSRWRSIISRVVKIPNGKEVDYDVSCLRILELKFSF